jgi:hypothetical protein
MRIRFKNLLPIICIVLAASVLHLPVQAEGTAAETPTLTLSEVSAKPGDDLTVAVDLQDNPGLEFMQFDVRYDTDSLSLTGVEDAGLEGWQRFKDRIQWFSRNKDDTSTGTILNLTFHVAETAEPGDVTVTLRYTVGNVTNHNEDDIFPQIEAGIVHIRTEDQVTPSISITEFAEGRLGFSVTAPEDADLIIACYDADGRTISCLLPPDGADSAELPTGTEHVKLFLVDSETFMPLCRAVSQ